MGQVWNKQSISLRPGTVVTGKWHQQRYIIKRELGKGAVGTVYLCEQNGKYAALKISENNASMTVEVNVLKSLAKVRGGHLGARLLDVDDWEVSRKTRYTFYVMEYLQGESLRSFISRHGHEWTGIFMLQMLEDLEYLHQAGWVFGDFKSENLIVLSNPPKVRFIDVGGTTQIGRAIKEYTEFYDRGYWGLGSRRADPGYDLFALVMVILNIYYPKRFEKGPNPKVTLFKKINDTKQLRLYKGCLKKALMGEYRSASDMRRELLNAIKNAPGKSTPTRRASRSAANGPFFAEVSGITIIALIYYLFSFAVPI